MEFGPGGFEMDPGGFESAPEMSPELPEAPDLWEDGAELPADTGSPEAPEMDAEIPTFEAPEELPADIPEMQPEAEIPEFELPEEWDASPVEAEGEPAYIGPEQTEIYHSPETTKEIEPGVGPTPSFNQPPDLEP